MQSACSFNALKGRDAYFAKIVGVGLDKRDLFFQIDSGAGRTLIGLNSICGDDQIAYEKIAGLLQSEIDTSGVKSHRKIMKTVTRENVEVYPCKLGNVSVMGTTAITLYFYIYLGTVNMPLLGFDYIDDCSFRHSIGKEIEIMAIADKPGRRFYPEDIIDFDKILEQYRTRQN